MVGRALRDRVVRPGDDELVGARADARASRTSPRASATVVRQPSALRRATQRLGGVDGAEDEEPRRRPEHVGEDAPPVDLDDAGCGRRGSAPVACVASSPGPRRPPRRSRGRAARLHVLASSIGEDGRRARRASATRAQPVDELGVGRLDVDVDLAPARQPDAQREVVGDPVGQQPRRRRRRGSRARRRRPRSRRNRRRPSRTSRRPSETPSFDPTGRGADRRVATTVAMANRLPSRRQRARSSAISRIAAQSYPAATIAPCRPTRSLRARSACASASGSGRRPTSNADGSTGSVSASREHCSYWPVSH